MDPEREEALKRQGWADEVVLGECLRQPLPAISIKPRGDLTEDEIKESVERCSAMGWVSNFGPLRHDQRLHITDLGRTRLERGGVAA